MQVISQAIMQNPYTLKLIGTIISIIGGLLVYYSPKVVQHYTSDEEIQKVIRAAQRKGLYAPSTVNPRHWLAFLGFGLILLGSYLMW